MPMLNFQARFADAVASGAKTQTIRATLRAKVGDTLYLYTGARTKACRKLGEGVCTAVWRAVIQTGSVLVEYDGGLFLTGCNLDPFAIADGFANFSEMREWFSKQHGLPFTGYLYTWELK